MACEPLMHICKGLDNHLKIQFSCFFYLTKEQRKRDFIVWWFTHLTDKLKICSLILFNFLECAIFLSRIWGIIVSGTHSSLYCCNCSTDCLTNSWQNISITEFNNWQCVLFFSNGTQFSSKHIFVNCGQEIQFNHIYMQHMSPLMKTEYYNLVEFWFLCACSIAQLNDESSLFCQTSPVLVGFILPY